LNTAASPSLRRRYPLHIYIASLFTILVLTTGILIASVDYSNARRLALEAVNDMFQRSARETLAELRAGHEPIRTLVTLFAHRPDTGYISPQEQLVNLPLISQALDSANLLSAFYIGFADGGLFSVQRLDFTAALRTFDAPEGAAFVVRISMPDKHTGQLRFYDREMHLLTARPADHADPRQQTWFQSGRATNGIARSPAFALASNEIGFSIAEATADHKAVVGGDLTLKDISASLSRQRASPSAQLALVDSQGQALAASRGSWARASDGPLNLPTLASLDLPILSKAFSRTANHQGVQTLTHEGRDWETLTVAYEIAGGEPLYLLMAAPHDELLADVHSLARQAFFSILGVLLLAVPATWWIARRISLSLRGLSNDAQAISRFNFEGNHVESFVLEVDELARAMSTMRSTIRQFLDIASRLSAERHFRPLLDGLISQTVGAAQADAGAVYLIDDSGVELRPVAWQNVDLERLVETPPPILLALDDPNHPLLAALREGKLQAGQTAGQQPDGLHWLASRFPGHRVGYLSVPLRNREGKTTGVLFLAKSASQSDFTSEQASFVDALSGTLAVAIDNQRLMRAQKRLLDAVIRVVAGAIDAKSPYTGGHCQRVPEIALMLADAACKADSGPFRDFRMDEDEWETLSIAAWLHDCGKLTTPEFVVDKATKLETLYDRIHEIRTRFEVLKRDAEIAYWRGLAEGGEQTALAAKRDTDLREIDEDFAFVANCNIGGEQMADADRERLHRIAGRTWERTLDDRLGISYNEAKRKAQLPAATLPVTESVIADRPDHRIPHETNSALPPDIRIKAPPYRLDLGELHCLSISRGTLTDEERFLINHHIVQTIIMLRGLPFPAYLKDVPDMAGNHHEHLDGSGYPRQLSAEAMTIQARMMAIADIFEALTAADRPYKRGKMLSEAVNLLAERVRMGHLDRDLFELFLRTGLHRSFAERFLDPAQIDEVDIEAVLARSNS
jgi:HD-GYP domain-containing protein (c-di-GMP phosphodiesterase class II)